MNKSRLHFHFGWANSPGEWYGLRLIIMHKDPEETEILAVAVGKLYAALTWEPEEDKQ